MPSDGIESAGVFTIRKSHEKGKLLPRQEMVELTVGGESQQMREDGIVAQKCLMIAVERDNRALEYTISTQLVEKTPERLIEVMDTVQVIAEAGALEGTQFQQSVAARQLIRMVVR